MTVDQHFEIVMKEFRQLSLNVAKNQADMNKVVYLLKGEMSGNMAALSRDMSQLTEAIYGNGQPGLIAALGEKVDEKTFKDDLEKLWQSVRRLSTFKTRLLTIWTTVAFIVVILWALSERYMRVIEIQKAEHSQQTSQ